MPDSEGFKLEEYGVRPPQYSEDALALGFGDHHDGTILYVPTWGCWLRWDGARWAKDNTLSVFDLVRAECRTAAATIDTTLTRERQRLARGLASAATIAAVERLARSDERYAHTPEAFDADPLALNTPDGVIDLRSGHLRPHRRGDLFTKVTAIAPQGTCPRWIRFLLEITQHDRPLVRYLQRLAGYTLTGVIREHAFAFLYGPGGNGKSVLLNTLAAMLGDYATTAMADVFTVGRTEQHPTHLANLRGARLVAVTETDEGRPWAESRIKSLTGGDRISARVMRGDPFEFLPIFKLWIAGNHRPALRNSDPAMRRRLHLLPLTFVPPMPDLSLQDKLHLELPGILAWAIRGCLAWQREGLNPPPAVRDASNEYFAEQDLVASWAAERCRRSPHATMPSRRAYADWRAWATERGEDPGSEKWFSAQLERHCAKKRTNTGAVFLGMELLPSATGVW